jgi:hypothetical protein
MGCPSRAGIRKRCRGDENRYVFVLLDVFLFFVFSLVRLKETPYARTTPRVTIKGIKLG